MVEKECTAAGRTRPGACEPQPVYAMPQCPKSYTDCPVGTIHQKSVALDATVSVAPIRRLGGRDSRD